MEEAVNESVRNHEAKVKTFEQRWPSEDEYDFSSLPRWLELGGWDKLEAMCLFFDIEPDGADISWDGYRNHTNTRIDLAKINNVGFLSEKDPFYEVPRSLNIKARQGTRAFDCDDADIEYKNYRIALVEPKLQRAWRLFERDNHDFYEIFDRGASRKNFINWAIENEIDIPWLDWALKKDLVDLEPEKRLDEQPKPPVLHTKERNTYLMLIAALLDRLNIDASKPGISKTIAGITDDFQAPVGEKTIRKILKEMKDALTTRKN